MTTLHPSSALTSRLTNVEFAKAVTILKSKIEERNTAASARSTLTSAVYNEKRSLSTLITELNGLGELTEQKVRVTYLKASENLKIPYAMAMLPYTDEYSEVPYHTVLGPRFWKVYNSSYVAIKKIVVEAESYAVIATTIDAITARVPAKFTDTVNWSTDKHTLNENGLHDATDDVVLIWSMLSEALQFNCDVRDTGILSAVDMRTDDNGWTSDRVKDQSRFVNKIRALSLQNIAALNYDACDQKAIGAWVRAFGVGGGVLPSPSSKLAKEYDFVAEFPNDAHVEAIVDFEKNFEESLASLCMNVIAMFGLFHLAKDHTYRSNDSNLIRIGTSYYRALRTIIPDDWQPKFEAHLEIMVRTAAHPFGLGQSYFVAKNMADFNGLAQPLQIRVAATPPAVQRLFIVAAASREWKAAPIGLEIDMVYASQLANINREIQIIMSNPPAYSGLHQYYGISEMKVPSESSMTDATSMMPMVYGFAMSQHQDDKDQKEGLALAMSLNNIKTQNRTAAEMYYRYWTSYFEKDDKAGLEAMIKKAKEMRGDGGRGVV